MLMVVVGGQEGGGGGSGEGVEELQITQHLWESVLAERPYQSCLCPSQALLACPRNPGKTSIMDLCCRGSGSRQDR